MALCGPTRRRLVGWTLYAMPIACGIAPWHWPKTLAKIKTSPRFPEGKLGKTFRHLFKR